MKRIVTSQQDAEELGSGFGGPHGPAEGPVWWQEGGYLLFSDIHGSRRMKWTARTAHHRSTKTAPSNGNGQTRDQLGRLVVCHHFSRCVDREEADGSITVIADRYRGLKLNRPNDVVVKSDGSIYFSDPPPRPPLTPPEHTPELDIAGVYRVSPDLSEINMVVRDFVNPNGLHVLAGREDPVHQRQQSASQADQGIRRRGQRHARSRQRATVLRHARRRSTGRARRHESATSRATCTAPDPAASGSCSPMASTSARFCTRAVNMAWGGGDWTTLFFTGPTTLHRIRLNIPGIPVPTRSDPGMKRSTERILTTHVGSLVRPPEILEAILTQVATGRDTTRRPSSEHGQRRCQATSCASRPKSASTSPATANISKPSFPAYVTERLGGLETQAIERRRARRR